MNDSDLQGILELIKGLDAQGFLKVNAQFERLKNHKRRSLKADARHKILAILHETGFTLDDIFAEKEKTEVKATRNTLPPAENIYEFNGQKWNRRGRTPQWVQKAAKEGGFQSVYDFLDSIDSSKIDAKQSEEMHQGENNLDIYQENA